MRIFLGFLWGVLLALAIWGLAVGLLLATPHELAVLLGFAGFMLLASRLVWGYGELGAFAGALQAGQNPDREAAEAGAGVHDAQELAAEVLAGLWLAALEPFRYAFIAAYVLLFLITLATKLAYPVLSVWGWFTGTSLIEGVFWGASIAALIVWALSAAAAAQVASLRRGPSRVSAG